MLDLLTVKQRDCVCVSGGSIDVNMLLNQLLAKGLIGQTDSSQSTSEPPATETSSAAAEDTAASDVSDVCLLVATDILSLFVHPPGSTEGLELFMSLICKLNIHLIILISVQLCFGSTQ